MPFPGEACKRIPLRAIARADAVPSCRPGLGWGGKGAVIAAGSGNIAPGLFYPAFYLRGKAALSLPPRHFAVRGVMSIGLPALRNTP